MDISDAGKDAQGVHWVRITAVFPAPLGLAADATMSKWPGGPDAIGSSLQQSLQVLDGIEATTGGVPGVSRIQVYPGALHLGALRQGYKTQWVVKFKADKWQVPTVAVKQPLMDQVA